MGNMLSYSGISTKIRAMQSKLINEQQLAEIAQLTSVPQVVSYLKKTQQYGAVWSNVDENALHRGEIEVMLKKTIFQNFSQIYSFADKEQRKFLMLYSKRYEIRVLKELLANIFDHRDTPRINLEPYRDFFRHHSRLDLDLLTASATMEELISSLKGNEFYRPLSMIQEHENPLVFDYGMALDLYYFNQIWKMKDKLFAKLDLKELTKAYGVKFDLLNLQFIQRSKQYFQINPADIYALLIPVNYKLKKEEVQTLTEASSMDEFYQILDKTYYGRRYKQQMKENTLEEFYIYLLRSTLEKSTRTHPYCAAVLYSYLYHKEHEVNRLTIAIECIRYGIDPADTLRYVLKN